MGPGDLPALKSILRAQAKARRDALSDDFRVRASKIICAHLIESDLLSQHKAIALYWPIGSEIDTKPSIDALCNKGLKCGLPVCENDRLVFRAYHPEIPLIKGKYDILIPPESADPFIPSLILAPLLAYNAIGTRLGYGGGWYDRTIKTVRQAHSARVQYIGLAYTCQKIGNLPRERHDVPLDGILTEKGFSLLTDL